MADDPTENIKKIAEEAGLASEKIEELTNALTGTATTSRDLLQVMEDIRRTSEVTGESGTVQIQAEEARLELLRQVLDVAQRKAVLTSEEIRQEAQKIEKSESILELVKEEEYYTRKNIDNLIGQKKEAFGIERHMASIRMIMNQMSKEEARQRLFGKLADGAASFANAIISASMEFDRVAANVAKATSTTQFAVSMEDLRVEALAAGVSVEQLGQNFVALNNNFSQFNRLDEKSAKQLAATATALNAANFSAEAFAKTLDIGVKALNMSTDEVETFSKELVSFGKSAGISMDRLSRDLASVGPKLVQFGTQGTRIFKEMSLASKNLGIELDRMFGIAEQYTTFEGAAGAAAKLNSVLGGNFINSLDLMNASLDNPTEAFRLMKDSMDASGKSFDDMSPAMKKVIAEAAGFSDVSEAARIFNMDISEGSEAIEEQAITQEKLNNMNRSFISLQEKLNKLMAEFTPIVTPVIDGLGKMVDYVASLGPGMKNFIFYAGMATVVVLGLGGAIMLLLKAAANIAMIKTAFMGPAKASGELAKELENGGGSVKSFGEKIKETASAAKGAWKEMLAFGAAIAFIGVGIGAAAYGLGQLVQGFKDLSGGAIIGALVGLAIVMGGFVAILYAMGPAIAALGAASAISAGPILAVGAAIALMGVGIGVAALGLAELVKSFATLEGLFTVLSNVDGSSLALAGLGLVGIAAGLTALAAVSLSGSVMDFFGAGPLSVLKELSGIATDSFAKNMEKIANSIEKITSSLSTTVNTNLIQQLERMESLANMGTLQATPAAVTAAPPTISVQDIVVRNTIRTEEGEAVAGNKPINISLTVPIQVDGSEFKNAVIGIANERIEANSNDLRTITTVVK